MAEQFQVTFGPVSDWGAVPEALRALPPGAQFCGLKPRGKTGEKDAVILAPGLGRTSFAAFYEPILKGLGCSVTRAFPVDKPEHEYRIALLQFSGCADGMKGDIMYQDSYAYHEIRLNGDEAIGAR
jgi:hypothetical protein